MASEIPKTSEEEKITPDTQLREAIGKKKNLELPFLWKNIYLLGRLQETHKVHTSATIITKLSLNVGYLRHIL